MHSLKRTTLPRGRQNYARCLETRCPVHILWVVLHCMQAKDLMGQCFQAGVNYFDNAEVYAEGAHAACPLRHQRDRHRTAPLYAVPAHHPVVGTVLTKKL